MVASTTRPRQRAHLGSSTQRVCRCDHPLSATCRPTVALLLMHDLLPSGGLQEKVMVGPGVPGQNRRRREVLANRRASPIPRHAGWRKYVVLSTMWQMVDALLRCGASCSLSGTGPAQDWQHRAALRSIAQGRVPRKVALARLRRGDQSASDLLEDPVVVAGEDDYLLDVIDEQVGGLWAGWADQFAYRK